MTKEEIIEQLNSIELLATDAKLSKQNAALYEHVLDQLYIISDPLIIRFLVASFGYGYADYLYWRVVKILEGYERVEVIPVLIEAVYQGKAGSRMWSALLLGRTRDQSNLPHLKMLLKDEDELVRAHARYALNIIEGSFYAFTPPTRSGRIGKTILIVFLTLFSIVAVAFIAFVITANIFPFLIDEFPPYPRSTAVEYNPKTLSDYGLTYLKIDIFDGRGFSADEHKALATSENASDIRNFYLNIASEQSVDVSYGKFGIRANKIDNLEALVFEGSSHLGRGSYSAVITLDHSIPSQNTVIRSVFPKTPDDINVIILLRGRINFHP